MVRTFRTVGTIVTGAGCLGKLGDIAARLGKRALLVTGGGSLGRSPPRGGPSPIERARDSLRASGLEVEEHSGVEREPRVETVDLVRKRLREGVDSGVDLVVGLGGGSVLDVAKAAAGLARAEGDAVEYLDGREVEGPGLPFIAVPTTAGTGSEVTPNAVVTSRGDTSRGDTSRGDTSRGDVERPRKASIRGEGLLPAAAIVDPELLVSLPPRVTAESGMDALVQAVESYVSVNATPLTEALSLQATTLLAKGLVRAYEDGADLGARTACAYGSLLAGMALANARAGVVHGLAHPVGARYGLPHGLVCAVLFAPSIRLNRAAARAKYREVGRRLARAFVTAETRGLTQAGITREEFERGTGEAPTGAPPADELVEAMLERLDIPRRLPCAMASGDFDARDGTIRPEEPDLRAVIAESMQSGSLKANPLKIEPSHLEALLREVTGV